MLYIKKERLFQSKNLPPPTISNNFKINAKHVEHASDVHFHEDFYMFNKHNTFSPEKKKTPRGFVAFGLDD